MAEAIAFRPARIDDAAVLAELVNYAGEVLPSGSGHLVRQRARCLADLSNGSPPSTCFLTTGLSSNFTVTL